MRNTTIPYSRHAGVGARSRLRAISRPPGRLGLAVALICLVAGVAAARDLDFSESFRAGGVDSIEVIDQRSTWGLVIRHDIDTEIVFEQSGSGRIEVALTGNVRSNRLRCLPELQVSDRGGTVRAEITTCSGPTAFLSMSGDMTLTVSVPRSWEGSYRVDASRARVILDEARLATVDLDVSSGRIDIGELEVDEVELHSSSGNITANRIAATSLRAEASSGELRFGTVEARESILETSSGSITADQIENDVEADASSGDIRLGFGGSQGRVDAETSSGSIVVEGIDGAVEIDATSGNVRMSFARLTGDSSIETSSGELTVALPEDSDFDLDISTSSGNIAVDFPVTMRGDMGSDDVEGSVGNGGPVLELDSSSGNIRVTRR